jgi:hypothetical protein
MKIGIMTFWWSDDNYGQILQCYALQKYLRDAGHDAYLIRYDPRDDYVKTPLWQKILKTLKLGKLFRYFKYRLTYPFITKLDKRRKFEEFRNKYIKQSDRIYDSYQELARDIPEACVYIVGSDQVWNPDCILFEKTNNLTKAYFLDFAGAGKKRIAYAASFGKERLGNDFIGEITPLLKKFTYVSVREKSGLDLCRQCGVKAEWVPDPTMLLSASDYRTLYIREHLPRIEKPYCFIYMLTNASDFLIKAIYTWTKKKNLKFVYVTGNGKYDGYRKLYATIPEWLYLIDNAEYVITSSFHGSLFSLLFHKQFGVIRSVGKDSEMNNRFDSLFEMFEIENRFIDNSFSLLELDMDWDNIDDTFKKNKNRVFLKL